MDKRLLDNMDRDIYDRIENKDYPNRKKILVTFSGVPYSGYEEIAEDLEERFGGIRINKNEVRTLLFKLARPQTNEEGEKLTKEYLDYILEKVKELPNKFVILEASVDRTYSKIKRWADENEYRLFIIGTQENRETVMKRIREDKDRHTADWFEDQLDRWYRDFERFKKIVGVDYMMQKDSIQEETELFKRLDILREKS